MNKYLALTLLFLAASSDTLLLAMNDQRDGMDAAYAALKKRTQESRVRIAALADQEDKEIAFRAGSSAGARARHSVSFVPTPHDEEEGEEFVVPQKSDSWMSTLENVLSWVMCTVGTFAAASVVTEGVIRVVKKK